MISRHYVTEGPGYFADFIQRHGIPYETVKIDAGESLPTSLAEYAGFVLMGGPMSVNDPLPWIPQALNLVREAVAADKPVLGHCLGGQLISKALGGEVRRNSVSEIGWLPVRPVANEGARRWFDGLPAQFDVFHWHGETFSIPPGAQHILQSDDCAHQGFTLGKTLALQCHIEMTADMVRAWTQSGEAELRCVCPTVQSAADITARLDQRVRDLQAIADRVYTRWIQGL